MVKQSLTILGLLVMSATAVSAVGLTDSPVHEAMRASVTAAILPRQIYGRPRL